MPVNSLIILVSLLIFVSIQSANAALPDPRWGHSAVLLSNKLYIFGGKVGEESDNSPNSNSNQLLTLDVSTSFSISNPTWESRFVGPRVSEHTISIGGSQNELLVLFGGEYPAPVPESPVFYYNTLERSSEWINANLSLGVPLREHTAVTRLSDSVNYFFGGIDTSNPNVSAVFQLQDLLVLDTRKNQLSNLTVDLPPGRFHHTATILPDGKMYLIGGYSINKLVDMNQIYVYDTVNARWSVQTAIGTLPSTRRDHTAVGTHDGNIIIYGGADELYHVSYNDIAILDTKQSQYTWSIIEANGKVPSPRYSHTATMVGTNMLVAFGIIGSLDNGHDIVDNNIYVFDTITRTWKDTYTPENLEFTKTEISPNPNAPNATGESSKESSKVGIIVGSIMGTVSFLALVGVGSFWVYRRRKQNSAYKPSNYSNIKEQTSNQVLVL